MKEPFEPAVRVQVLPEASLSQIHAAALEVLEKTGVQINTEEGRRILVDAGCTLEGGNVVKIPPRLVEKALETAPSSVTLDDRLGEPRCFLEGWKTSFGTGSDCPFILDRETMKRRLCTYDDVGKAALVLDALEHIDFIMPVGIISDRPRHVADVYSVEATMMNTVKPVVFTAHNKKTFQASIDLAATVAGGIEKLQKKPTICLYAEPTSPLRHMPEATDKVIHAARKGIPVVFTPCPLGGATAPATGAGIVVQATAESFSGLVLHQLAKPGAPFIFGGVLYMLDMATTISPYGSAELHQLCAALTDVAHHIKLPMFGTCGCSDSKRVDAQAGLEVGFSVLMATLNGQNLIHDIGFLESALITSYEMYILTDEAIGMAKHIAKGVTVNPDTLAVDVIDTVDHKADFIIQDHTLNFFRRESHFPKLLDRLNYEDWEKQGSKTLDTKLKEKADEIIRTHKAEPIDGSLVRSLQKILTDVEK